MGVPSGAGLYSLNTDSLEGGKFTVVSTAGIKQRKERVAEMLAKELPKVKPDKWGCVQVSQLWYVHMCIQQKEKERAREQERKNERERKTEKV